MGVAHVIAGHPRPAVNHQNHVVARAFAEGGNGVAVHLYRNALHFVLLFRRERRPMLRSGRRPREQTVRAAFIDIDGTRTRYLYEGDKDETLLLVHGFGLSADIWGACAGPAGGAFFGVCAGHPRPRLHRLQGPGRGRRAARDDAAPRGLHGRGGDRALRHARQLARRPAGAPALCRAAREHHGADHRRPAHAGLRFRHAAAGDDPGDHGRTAPRR